MGKKITIATNDNKSFVAYENRVLQMFTADFQLFEKDSLNEVSRLISGLCDMSIFDDLESIHNDKYFVRFENRIISVKDFIDELNTEKYYRYKDYRTYNCLENIENLIDYELLDRFECENGQSFKTQVLKLKELSDGQIYYCINEYVFYQDTLDMIYNMSKNIGDLEFYNQDYRRLVKFDEVVKYFESSEVNIND